MAANAQLILAAASGRLEDVKELLEARAGPDSQTLSGATPLYIASRQGHADVVEVLLRLGAHPAAAMQDGSAPLFIAAWHGHLDTVRALLCGDAEVNQVTSTGATPLFAAAMSGHSEIAEELLRREVRIDQATQEGVTPLMAASAAGHVDVVHSLLRVEAGLQADAEHLRADRETAISVAMRNGHEDIAHVLRAVLVAGSLGHLACAACARHWRRPASRFDWAAIEAAERTVFVELARAAHRCGPGRPAAPSGAAVKGNKVAPSGRGGGESSGREGSSCSGGSSSSGTSISGNAPVAAATENGGASESFQEHQGAVGDAAGAAAVATPYLGRADALEERQPVVAYYCRVFAAGRLLSAMKRGGWSQANESTLASTLDKVERAQPLLSLARGREEIESFVLASMRLAEGDGAATAFRDVSLLLDVLEWFFGTLTPDWEVVAEYARRRAAEV
uniref:Vta1/callose synthase N-terminal domain-containing protein n=1 Tax=Alexandrium monilatum TaxID=311494 RepID=A0A7S4RPG8_9DINO